MLRSHSCALFFSADSDCKELPGLVLCESKCALLAAFGVFRFVLCPAFASNIFVQSWIDLYRANLCICRTWKPAVGMNHSHQRRYLSKFWEGPMGSKAYALQPSSQYIPVLCLETLLIFRNRSQKFRHLEFSLIESLIELIAFCRFVRRLSLTI